MLRVIVSRDTRTRLCRSSHDTARGINFKSHLNVRPRLLKWNECDHTILPLVTFRTPQIRSDTCPPSIGFRLQSFSSPSPASFRQDMILRICQVKARVV